VQELAELVEASSYPSTWILKPLPEALKPPPSRDNNTGLTGTALINTAFISTAPAGVTAGGIINDGINRTDVSTDPYKLNKLSAGKPGFIKNGEMIIRHKFKYFKKGDKKGQVYNGQLFVAIKPQACPYIKVLLYKDFIKNTINAYLNYVYMIKINGRTEKDEFIKIFYIAAESYKPEPLKELIIYALYE